MADSTKCDRCGLHADPTTMVQGICDRCTDYPSADEMKALEDAIALILDRGAGDEIFIANVLGFLRGKLRRQLARVALAAR